MGSLGRIGSSASPADEVGAGTMTIRLRAGGGGRCELQYPDADGVYTATVGDAKRLGKEYFATVKRANASCKWEDTIATVGVGEPEPGKSAEVDDSTILGVCRALWQAGITKTKLDLGTAQLDVRPRRDAREDLPSIRILETGVAICRPVIVADADVSRSLIEPPSAAASETPDAVVLASSKSDIGWSQLHPILAELVDGGVRAILIEER